MDELPSSINLSNARGDFMRWAKDKVLLSYNEITGRLNAVKDKDAKSDKFVDFILNEKQKLFRDIVREWVEKWAEASKDEGPWPKALRLILMGSPGAGKSRFVGVTMDALGNTLGISCKDVVRQITPRGCVLLQISAGATTVHKLFGLNVKSKQDDVDGKKLKCWQKTLSMGCACLSLVNLVWNHELL